MYLEKTKHFVHLSRSIFFSLDSIGYVDLRHHRGFSSIVLFQFIPKQFKFSVVSLLIDL